MELRNRNIVPPGTPTPIAPSIPPRTPSSIVPIVPPRTPTTMTPPPLPQRTGTPQTSNIVTSMTDTTPPTMIQQVKLPPFSEEFSELWLKQVKVLLEIYSPAVKREALLRHVPTFIWSQCGADPFAEYEETLNILEEHFQKSQEEKLSLALQQISLGDRKPSIALRHLKQLIPNNYELLRFQFFSLLPNEIKTPLKVIDDGSKTLEELAKVADKILPGVGNNNNKILTGAITQQENILTNTKLYNGFCWFHFNFGKKARKCIEGCSYQACEQKAKNDQE